MTREEMLEKAEKWLIAAEDYRTEDMEIRALRIAETWLRLAEEARKGGASASPDVN